MGNIIRTPCSLYKFLNTLTFCTKYDTTSKEITYDENKTFVIQHPTEYNKYLVHSCLEGPESGVYYRGRGVIEESNNICLIKLLNIYVDINYNGFIYYTILFR